MIVLYNLLGGGRTTLVSPPCGGRTTLSSFNTQTHEYNVMSLEILPTSKTQHPRGLTSC
jgi:hypothetical protein